MDEKLRKKYIPMTETIYYTLLAVIHPRHGYAIMQYVKTLTKGRILLGTGTLYTMVGRLLSDGLIVILPYSEKKTYRITENGMALLREETGRLQEQFTDGSKVLAGGVFQEICNSFCEAEQPEAGGFSVQETLQAPPGFEPG